MAKHLLPGETMPRDKTKALRRLRQQIDESIAEPRPNKPASRVFRQLRAHHAGRSAAPKRKSRVSDAKSKVKALLALARKRKAARLDGYHRIGEFHGGLFECKHVSPWTKSGHNVDADVMVIGQDWSSYDVLASKSPNHGEVAKLGFDRTFPTNAKLDDLLQRHFGLGRNECYLTNLFVLVKRGSASTSIPMKHLVWSAREFTLEEVRIVAPRLVICLGLRTFRALMRATGQHGSPNTDQAIKSPFKFANSTIHCVAHTGALGMNNRGPNQVDRDWRKLARFGAARHL